MSSDERMRKLTGEVMSQLAEKLWLNAEIKKSLKNVGFDK